MKLTPSDISNEHFQYECGMLQSIGNLIPQILGKGLIFNIYHQAFCTHAWNLLNFLDAPKDESLARDREKYLEMIRNQILTLDFDKRTGNFDEKIIWPRDHKRMVEIINSKLSEYGLHMAVKAFDETTS